MNLNSKARDENEYDVIVAGTGWLFNYSGAPWLTQYWTRQVKEEVYVHLSYNRDYSGCKDKGLVGSLSVFLKTGLYPNKEWGSHPEQVPPLRSE